LICQITALFEVFMNWEAIGAAAELLGAIGVIASLLYLATQIRQGTQTARDAAFRDIFTGVNFQLAELLKPENSAALFRGLMDYKELVGPEKFKFDSLLAGYLNMVESSIIANEAMLLDDDSMEQWGHYIRTRLLAYPGTLAWWEEAQAYFSVEMRDWMVRQISKTDMNSDIWGIK
jgi:hypothetical protein